MERLVNAGPNRVSIQLTKFDLAILDDQVRCTGFVIDISRLRQKLEQFLSVNEGLIDGAINVAEHIEGSIQLMTTDQLMFKFDGNCLT